MFYQRNLQQKQEKNLKSHNIKSSDKSEDFCCKKNIQCGILYKAVVVDTLLIKLRLITILLYDGRRQSISRIYC